MNTNTTPCTRLTALFALLGLSVTSCTGDPPRGAVGFPASNSKTRTELLFEPVPADDVKITEELLGRLVKVIEQRLNPAGTEKVTVRTTDERRISIVVPTDDEGLIEQTRRAVCRPGKFEFAILANQLDHESLIERAGTLDVETTDVIRGGRLAARWTRPFIGIDGKSHDVGDYGMVAFREFDSNGEQRKEYLVLFEQPQFRIDEKFLQRVYMTKDEIGGPALGFNLNDEGAKRLERLTRMHRPKSSDGFKRRMSILVDGRILTAPNLRSVIAGYGVITGSDKSELQDLEVILRSGTLDVPLRPVTEQAGTK